MRTLLALLGALVLGALAPALASAKIYEVGDAAPAAIPSCPNKPCFAMTRTTGYQAKVGTLRSVDTIPRDGNIVAWTISLGKTGKKQTAFFAKDFGAEPEARITILRAGTKLHYRVVHQGPLVNLTPFLGQTVQFALPASIPVKKGWVVALTVPTWAPVLADDLASDTSWRASRGKGGCAPGATSPQTALTSNQVAQFFCLYKTARLTYSATLVSSPGTPVISTPTVPTPPSTTTSTSTTPTTPPVTTPTTTTTATTPKATTPK
jgi:hypothetical protein